MYGTVCIFFCTLRESSDSLHDFEQSSNNNTNLKPPESLSTWPLGQRYLDHMLDQLNSHGQLRLSVQVPLRCLDGLFGETWNFRSWRMNFNLKSHEASQAFIGTTGMVGLWEDLSTFQCGLHHGVWSPGAGAKIVSLHPRKRSMEPENLESLLPEWFWVGGMYTPENYDGTREWRFGVLFSFSNRWFAGSISIFQGVSIVGKSFRYTVDIQKFAEHSSDF